MTKSKIAQAIDVDLNVPLDATKPLTESMGKRYRHAAIDFQALYPIGSTLTWDEFTQFALQNGLIDIASLPCQADMDDKQSNGWLAHLQRRHQSRAKLNNAARHYIMNEYAGAYTIEPGGEKGLMVQSVAVALIENEVAKKIKTLSTTKKKQLTRLMQSADWSQLPPHERGLAETINVDIDNFVERINLEANQLQNKFNRVAHRLKHLVNTGQINTPNGGITGLLQNNDGSSPD